MLVFKISDGNSSLYVTQLDVVSAFIPPIEDQDEDNEYTISIIDMDEKEFSELDHFDGF